MSIKYNSDTYQVVSRSGIPHYRGPLRRAEVWAKVFKASIQFFEAKKVKQKKNKSRDL